MQNDQLDSLVLENIIYSKSLLQFSGLNHKSEIHVLKPTGLNIGPIGIKVDAN